MGKERQGDRRVDFYTEEFALSSTGNSLIHSLICSFTRSVSALGPAPVWALGLQR